MVISDHPRYKMEYEKDIIVKLNLINYTQGHKYNKICYVLAPINVIQKQIDKFFFELGIKKEIQLLM